MNRVGFGQAIQILANVGVIASIVFLAVQLRQNNELFGVQIRSNSLDRQVGTADLLLENPHLLELLRKDAATLSPAELDTVIVLGVRALSGFQIAYEDTKRGIGDDEASLLRRIQAVWSRPHLHYGMPIAWATFRERGNPDFVAWMERTVVNSEQRVDPP